MATAELYVRPLCLVPAKAASGLSGTIPRSCASLQTHFLCYHHATYRPQATSHHALLCMAKDSATKMRMYAVSSNALSEARERHMQCLFAGNAQLHAKRHTHTPKRQQNKSSPSHLHCNGEGIGGRPPMGSAHDCTYLYCSVKRTSCTVPMPYATTASISTFKLKHSSFSSLPLITTQHMGLHLLSKRQLHAWSHSAGTSWPT